jgi:O-antigen ligase
VTAPRAAAVLVRLADGLYGAALITLPWIGFGTIHLLTGVDTGAGFQPSYLLLAGALLVRSLARFGAAGRFAPPPQLRREAGRYAVAAMVLAAVVGLSAIGIVTRPGVAPPSVAWARFAKQALQLGVMVCFVVYPALWTRSPDRWLWTVRLLGAGLALQIFYAAIQAVHFHQPLAVFAALERIYTSNPAILAGSDQLYLGGTFRQIPRLRGTACEPLYLGNYLLAVLPLMGLLRRRPLRVGLVVAGALLLVLTWSRGAYLAAVAAVLVGALLWWRSGLPGRPARGAAAAAAVGALAAAVIVVAWGPRAVSLPAERLWQSFQTADWSNLTRFYSMQAAWRGFIASPVHGLGWGQFPYHFGALVDPRGLQSQFTLPVVNNFPLQILCETGLVGGVAGTAAFVVLARAVWRVTGRREADAPDLPSSRDPQNLIVVLCATACVGVWTQLFTFSQYNLPHIWLSVGLLLASLGAQNTAAEDAEPRSARG